MAAGDDTLSTHDTKRGEDVRARIGVLSQVPSLWAEFVARWETEAPSPDAATGQFLWQNIFGVWPLNGEVTEQLRDRLHAYADKAAREAALHTSWNDPNTEFENAIHRWLDAVLDGPVAGQLTELVAQLNPHGASDALGQKLLALTVPGIPDVYQGTELWDDSLVDPDNRRAIDYAARRAALAELQHPKLRVVTTALRLRRTRPDGFLHGDYVPLLADGDASDHILAFGRGADVVVTVTRWTVHLAETGWGNTVLPLPEGIWKTRSAGPSRTDRRRRPSCSPTCPSHYWSAIMAEFRVWAPKPALVRLDVDGAVHAMTPTQDGWWHASVDAPADARYGFLLDDDPTVLPDPRSPRQPDGVHKRSQLWDPTEATWTDDGWSGRGVEGAVIYELHIGTFTEAGTFDAPSKRWTTWSISASTSSS